MQGGETERLLKRCAKTMPPVRTKGRLGKKNLSVLKGEKSGNLFIWTQALGW
jgi:hypothetical protein